jgi:multicomponent Na+:H+ antiporter subunit B
MSRRARLGLFLLAGPGLAAVLVVGFTGLPAFGHYHGAYGLIVNNFALSARHATDLVTALNFDIRAFDTLGEEYILFTAAVGVALVLRDLREGSKRPHPAPPEQHGFAGASDSLRALALLLAPLLVALGGYIVLHGALTPGGGFQGGVVLAAGPLGALLSGRYLAFKRVAPHAAIEGLDAFGAWAYAMLGLGGLVFASSYLQNYLPLGTPSHLLSGGLMPLNSIAVGLEVAGAFLLVWTEFLDEALISRRGEGS